MIVNEGKAQLLRSQLTMLNECYYGLATADLTVEATTDAGDVLPDEAAWSGYARVQASFGPAVSILSDRAITYESLLPLFTNTSGVAAEFFVVFLYHPGEGVMIDVRNIGYTTIPDGGNYPLAPAFTDDWDGVS